MCKYDHKNKGRRIDPCLKKLIAYLNNQGIETVSCCCGHGKYPMTIFIKTDKQDVYHEICHDIFVESKAKRFYKSDKQGRYFVPEVKMMLEGNNERYN